MKNQKGGDMKNSNLQKQIVKDAISEFEERFSSSDFWIDNYPANYYEIKRFIKEVIKKVEEKTEIFCESQYQDFLKELRAGELV